MASCAAWLPSSPYMHWAIPECTADRIPWRCTRALLHSVRGDTDGIGTHVGDQSDEAFLAKFHALVQALRDHHRAFYAEAQFARRILLQFAGREGRRRVAPTFLFLRRRTIQLLSSSAARIVSASSPLLTSTFSSTLPHKARVKGRRFRAARCASIVQYSFFSNALISRSRSTIRRSATVCTRRQTNLDEPYPKAAAKPGSRPFGRVRGAPAAHLPGCGLCRAGAGKAARTAFCVISLNVTRRMRSLSACAFFVLLFLAVAVFPSSSAR